MPVQIHFDICSKYVITHPFDVFMKYFGPKYPHLQPPAPILPEKKVHASIGHRPELPSQTLIPARALRKLHRALLSPARLDDRRPPEVACRNLPEHVLG
jgi:hypothetical protein